MPHTSSAQIADEVRARIDTGALVSGDRVPSTREITREWGVAMATASKALAQLCAEGIVSVRPGVGTVVTGKPRRRPPRPDITGAGEDDSLSRARVVRTAVSLADSDGLATLSMRRVATELNVSTMALYRHVAGKEELLLLMGDACCAELRFPARPPRGWRARLEFVAVEQWRLYQVHPWMAHVISMTRPQMMPHGMMHTEWALAAVDGLGLAPNVMMHMAVCLMGYTRGVASSLEPERQAEQDSGLSADEWLEVQTPSMETVFHSGRYPTLLHVVDQPEVDITIDSLFLFGLRQLLDGFGATIAAARSSRTQKR